MTTGQRTIYDEALEFLASAPSLEEIINFKASPDTQARIRHLLDGNREKGLSAEERGELDEIERLDHVIAMLKVKARQKLAEEK